MGTELDKDADSVEDGEADDNSYSGPWYSWGEDEGLALALQRKLSLESHQHHPYEVAATFETHPTIYPTYRLIIHLFFKHFSSIIGRSLYHISLRVFPDSMVSIRHK